MMLLRSSAHHVFWLGRYLMRMQNLCQQLPFSQDAVAKQFCQVFSLVAEDSATANVLLMNPDQPCSIPYQLNMVRDNVQELRGVLGPLAYADLMQHIKSVQQDPASACAVVSKCTEILQNESAEITAFFNLGLQLEHSDAALRLEQNLSASLSKLQSVFVELPFFIPDALMLELQVLQESPNAGQFYHLMNQLDEQFEVCL